MRRPPLLLACALTALFAAHCFAAAITIQPVASPNFPAPGLNLNYSGFSTYPGIDRAGDISFVGSTFNGTSGVWSGPVGDSALLALSSAPVAGLPGATWDASPSFQIDQEEGGLLAFIGKFDPSSGGTASAEFLVEPNGVQAPIYVSNQPAPGTGGASFGFRPNSMAVNSSGQYAFTDSLQVGGSVNSTNAPGLWGGSNGTLQLLARDGSQVPGQAAGVTWQGNFGFPVVTPGNATVFDASLSDGSTGIFSTSNGTTTELAKSNTNGVGQIISQQPTANDNGSVEFSDGTNDWLVNSSGVQKIAGAGSPIAGGGTLSSVSIGSLADSNQIFFIGKNSANVFGLYTSSIAGGVIPIAVPGSAVPVLPAGWTYYSVNYPPLVNAQGQVVFDASVKDPSGDVLVNYIFTRDPGGNLTLVATPKTQYVLEPNVSIAVGMPNYYPFNDVRLGALNNNNDLVFTATGDGNVLLVTLPEPSAVATMMLAAFGFALFRRPGRNARRLFND